MDLLLRNHLRKRGFFTYIILRERLAPNLSAIRVSDNSIEAIPSVDNCRFVADFGTMFVLKNHADAIQRFVVHFHKQFHLLLWKQDGEFFAACLTKSRPATKLVHD